MDAEKSVTLTVTDANGKTATVVATVKASPLLSSLTVTPRASSPCATGSSATGGKACFDLLRRVSDRIGHVEGLQLVAVINRQVRFDAVQGPYSFAVDQAATVFAKTLTALTDQNGQALVTLKSDVVPSQVAPIRATDVTSGNRVDGSVHDR